jgi:hypothetical protein
MRSQMLSGGTPNQMKNSFAFDPVIYSYVTDHSKLCSITQSPFYHACRVWVRNLLRHDWSLLVAWGLKNGPSNPCFCEVVSHIVLHGSVLSTEYGRRNSVCYSLDLVWVCSPKFHVLEAWSPVWLCWDCVTVPGGRMRSFPQLPSFHAKSQVLEIHMWKSFRGVS